MFFTEEFLEQSARVNILMNTPHALQENAKETSFSCKKSERWLLAPEWSIFHPLSSSRCDYKRFCRFRVSNYACGEASHWYSRTHKHLQVRYRCVEQKHHHHHHHHGHHHHDQPLPSKYSVNIYSMPKMSSLFLPECKANMVLVYNATSCPRTCPPERYYFKACSIIRHPTCICKHNWVIDHLTGNCVPRDKCPYYGTPLLANRNILFHVLFFLDYNHPSHTTHEHYTDCGTCELCPRDCNHPIVCASYCRPPGYYCDANYCRDSYGKCVRKKCCN